MVSRMPGRHLEMILGLVAPFSQSMSSFRATATHFVPETMILDVLQTVKYIIWTYKSKFYSMCVLQIQNLCIANTKIWYKGSDYILEIKNPRITNTKIWYKGSDYILQIQNVCIADTEILYKGSDYILQIKKLYVLNTQFILCKHTISVCCKHRNLCIC